MIIFSFSYKKSTVKSLKWLVGFDFLRVENSFLFVENDFLSVENSFLFSENDYYDCMQY